jgi:hypothetical protein
MTDPHWPASRDLVVLMARLAGLRDADVLTEDEYRQERVKVVETCAPHTGARSDSK